MIIDVSSNQGKINWEKVSKTGVERIILRATTQNGKLDVRTMENYNGILQNMNATMKNVDFYKFSYVRDYAAARMECLKTLDQLDTNGIRLEVMDFFYLDLEGHGGRDYTKDEANEVILGYRDQCREMGVRLGLYFNYNYARNIVDKVWSFMPLWVARYNSTLGDVEPWKPHIWQYTSKGTIDGIPNYVDISKRIGVGAV